MTEFTYQEILNALIDKFIELNPDATALLDGSRQSIVRTIEEGYADQLYELYTAFKQVEANINYDTATSEALDKHLSDKGLTRGGALPSQLTMRIGSTTIPTKEINIPINFLISTEDTTPIIFSTIESGSISPLTTPDGDGYYTIQLQAQSTTNGIDTRVFEDTVTNIQTPLQGINFATNDTNGTGGRDQESDASVIARLKQSSRIYERWTEDWIISTTKEEFTYVKDVSVTPATFGNGTLTITITGFNPLTPTEIQDVEDYFNSDTISPPSGWNVIVGSITAYPIDIEIDYVYRYETSVTYSIIESATQDYFNTLLIGEDFIYQRYASYLIENIEQLESVDIVTGGSRLIDVPSNEISDFNSLTINNYVEV